MKIIISVFLALLTILVGSEYVYSGYVVDKRSNISSEKCFCPVCYQYYYGRGNHKCKYDKANKKTDYTYKRDYRARNRTISKKHYEEIHKYKSGGTGYRYGRYDRGSYRAAYRDSLPLIYIYIRSTGGHRYGYNRYYKPYYYHNRIWFGGSQRKYRDREYRKYRKYRDRYRHYRRY